MDSVLSWMKQGKAGGVIFLKDFPKRSEWTNRIQDSVKVKSLLPIDGEWGLSMRLDSTISLPHADCPWCRC